MELHRRINEFREAYQLRTDLVKDENDDLFEDSYGILNRWKNYFCQILNLHGVKMLGRQNRIWLSLVLLRLKLLLTS